MLAEDCLRVVLGVVSLSVHANASPNTPQMARRRQISFWYHSTHGDVDHKEERSAGHFHCGRRLLFRCRIQSVPPANFASICTWMQAQIVQYRGGN